MSALCIQAMDVTGPEAKGYKLSKSQLLRLVCAVQSGLAFKTGPEGGER